MAVVLSSRQEEKQACWLARRNDEQKYVAKTGIRSNKWCNSVSFMDECGSGVSCPFFVEKIVRAFLHETNNTYILLYLKDR